MSPGMVAVAQREHPEVEFRQGDLLSLPASDGEFGSAVALYSIIHLGTHELAPAFSELRRVLVTGGRLLVAFHVGDEVRHVDELWGQGVDLDFRFLETAAVVEIAGWCGIRNRGATRAQELPRGSRDPQGLCHGPTSLRDPNSTQPLRPRSGDWHYPFNSSAEPSAMPTPEFTDPRQVVIYDAVNSYEPGTQSDFYLGVAEEFGAETVVDLGCGTGIITLEFASRGYRMIGVDPSPLMLEVAQQKPGADAVEWVQGGAGQLGNAGRGPGIMSGHVAQFILKDAEWLETLAGLSEALRPGGYLAFESRDPRARGVGTLDRPQADNPGLPLRSNRVLDRGHKRRGRYRSRGRPSTSLAE